MIITFVALALSQSPATPTKASVKEVILPIPVEQAWALWADSNGATSYGVPQGANIELRPGGKYEIYFDKNAPEGERGSEGCQVLSFNPYRMISFTWNAPPTLTQLRKANARTQVNVFFDKVPEGTKVRLVQHGLGIGKEWDQYYDYFDKAWTMVLGVQRDWAGKQPKSPPSPLTDYQSLYTDGAVEVSYTRYERARFRMNVPATTAKVWRAIATSDGFHETFGVKATIELQPGGKYDIWGGKGNTVLAFTTQQMLSVSGSAPEKFPNVQKGGTWGTYFLESTGPSTCTLTLETAGWRRGDDEFEKAFDYFLRANPKFLNMLYTRLGGSRLPPAPDRMEREINAPVSEVWKLFTSNDGLKQWMATQVEMEALKPGAKIRTRYGTDGKPGDEGGIEHTILCVEPERLFAFQCTKQPEKFPFKNAIKDIYFVLHLQPIGSERTLLTMTTVGYTNDKESRQLQAFFEEGNSQTFDALRAAVARNRSSQGSPPARR
jgi:uncharacterized protein YndB with AHSA1/START domain